MAKIYNWDPNRGFGFCKVDGRQVFVHFSVVNPRPARGVDLNDQEVMVEEIDWEAEKGPRATKVACVLPRQQGKLVDWYAGSGHLETEDGQRFPVHKTELPSEVFEEPGPVLTRGGPRLRPEAVGCQFSFSVVTQGRRGEEIAVAARLEEKPLFEVVSSSIYAVGCVPAPAVRIRRWNGDQYLQITSPGQIGTDWPEEVQEEAQQALARYLEAEEGQKRAEAESKEAILQCVPRFVEALQELLVSYDFPPAENVEPRVEVWGDPPEEEHVLVISFRLPAAAGCSSEYEHEAVVVRGVGTEAEKFWVYVQAEEFLGQYEDVQLGYSLTADRAGYFVHEFDEMSGELEGLTEEQIAKGDSHLLDDLEAEGNLPSPLGDPRFERKILR